MFKTFSFFMLAGLLSLAACNDSAKTESTNKMSNTDTAFDLTAAKQWIASDNAKFSDEIKRGDSNAVAAHYHSDAQILMSGMEPVSRKDIAGTWGMFSRMGVKELRIKTTDLVGNDQMLTETGNYEIIGPENKEMDHGVYVVTWRKENDAWKIYRDIPVSTIVKK